MIPASFIDKLTALLAWLAERLAEIRERNALRAQAECEQAEREQAERERAERERAGPHQTGTHQTGEDPAARNPAQPDSAAQAPTPADALLAGCTLSQPASAPSSAPQSPRRSALPSRPDQDSFLPTACASPACPAPIRLDARDGSPTAARLAVAPPAGDPGARPALGRRAGADPRRGRPGKGFFRDGPHRARVPARHAWPGPAAVRVRAAEPVGWRANSGRTGQRRLTP